MIHKTRSQIKKTVFPEVLKAISHGILLQKEKIPILEILPTFSLDYIDIYQTPIILTELFQHNLINVSYLTACYLYQVMMTLHFLNDVANDAESTQK